ncbi:MAG: PIN domain-containing protein [Candidatus Nanoarchaeia archaeon]
MKFILDSYAWVEYLEGNSKGIEVRRILKGKNEIYTLSLCIAEVISRAKRKGANDDIAYRAMTMNSKIISIDEKISRDAGILHGEIKKKIKDFGLVDAYILLIARKLKAKIITGDKHFKNFKEAILLK